jgi:hypoxia-inducible factor 1 alpha
VLFLVLKEEPDDLTHLAPTAGDVCVPLEGAPFLEDMFDDLMMNNYCPLLPEEPISPNSPELEPCSPQDPFLTYQETSTFRADSESPSSLDKQQLSPEVH